MLSGSEAGGNPKLRLETGDVDRAAAFKEVTGGDTLVLEYTIQSGDVSSDLGAVTSNAIELGTSTIQDRAGNTASVSLDGLAEASTLAGSSSIVVDTEAPTVSVTGVALDLAAGTLEISGSGFGDTPTLDWSKLTLDINNDAGSDNLTFSAADDLKSDPAVTITDTKITASLVDDDVSNGTQEITALTGIGATGGADYFDFARGFFADAAGNVVADEFSLERKTAVISEANFISDTRTLSLKGSNLNLLSDGSLSASDFDWSKLTWNVKTASATNAQNIADANSLSNITSVTLEGSLALKITLAQDAPILSVSGVGGKTGVDGVTDTFTIGTGFVSGLDETSLPTAADIDADDTGPKISSVSVSGLSANDLIGPDKPATIIITLDEDVFAGTAITGQVNTLAAKAASEPSGGYAIVFEALSDGDVLTGTYTPVVGDSTTADLTLENVSLNLPTSRTDLQPLQDTDGSLTKKAELTLTDIANIVDNVGKITVDTTPPASQLTAASYTPKGASTAAKITLTADTSNNFDGLGTGTSITGLTSTNLASFFDWSKLQWISDEGDSEDVVSFVGDGSTTNYATYIDYATITNEAKTTMDIVLTDAGAALLEGRTDFGNLGGSVFGKGKDALKLTEGFLKDKAGNIANLDGSTDGSGDATVDVTNDYVLFSASNAFSAESTSIKAVTYGGTQTAPALVSFTAAADTANGVSDADNTYILGETIILTATVDKAVTKGSEFTAKLLTGFSGGRNVTFEAAADGTTLVSSYTIQAGDTTSAIRIDTSTPLTAVETDSQYTTQSLATALPDAVKTSTSGHENFKTAITVDGVVPETVLTAASYTPKGSSSAAKITLTAATDNSFDGIGTDDIKANFDWGKLEWIVDEGDSPTSVTFEGDGSSTTYATYIASATVTNEAKTTMDIVLTDAGAALLEGRSDSDFGNLGGSVFGKGKDALKLTEGFLKDANGNILNLDGSTDSDGAATVDVTNDYVLFSASNAFSAESASIKAVSYGGTQTAPALVSFTAAADTGNGVSAADDTYILGETIILTATVDKDVTMGSQFTATLNTGSSGGRQVTFEAAADGTTLVSSYTIQTGDTSSAIRIDTTPGLTAIETDSQYTTQSLPAVLPDAVKTSTSGHENFKTAITVDGVVPETVLTGASYTPKGASTAAKITLTAATDNSFDGVGTGDIKANFDWGKLEWIVDEGDSPTSVTYGDSSTYATYIASATVTNEAKTTMDIVLTDAGAALLEGRADTDFGNLGGSVFGKGKDALKLTEGFLKDANGNILNLDGSTDSDGAATVDVTNDYVLFSASNAFSAESASIKAVSYGGTQTAPALVSFTAAADTGNGVSAADDTYILGETIILTATVDKDVTMGSQFTATLNTGSSGGRQVTFEAAADGTTLVSSYTIQTGDTSSAIRIDTTPGLTAIETDSQYTTQSLPAVLPDAVKTSTSGHENFKTAITVDGVVPETVLTGASYTPKGASTAAKITLTAATDNSFDGVGTGDIKANFDWGKLEWIVDEGDSPTSVTYGDSSTYATYIASATVTNEAKTTMDIVLTDAGAALLEGRADTDFGNLGGSVFGKGKDALKLTEGFLKDANGNILNLDGSTDSDGAATVDVTNDYVLFSASNAFSAESASIKAVSYGGTQTAPALVSFTAAADTGNGVSAADDTYILGETIILTATVDKDVTMGSQFTATLNTGSSGGRQVTFEAAADGTTLVSSYTIQTGDTSSAIRIDTTPGLTAIETDSQYTTQSLPAVLPDAVKTSTSGHENFKTAITVDGDGPDVVVTSVDYTQAVSDVVTGRLTFKGSNFDSIGAQTTSTDIKAFLGRDGTKITWDVDAASSGAGETVTILAADIASANVLNDETLQINLTNAKDGEIEGFAGYALASADQVIVDKKFFSDTNLNYGLEDVITKSVNFTDSVAPQILNVTTSASPGTYRVGEGPIPITINFDEPIKAGSTMSVQLNSGKIVDLSYESPNKVVGDYVIGAGQSADGLDVEQVTAVSVQDLYGRAVSSSIAIPDDANLTTSAAINITTLENASIIDSGVSEVADTSDKFIFRFDDVVENQSQIVSELVGKAFGADVGSTYDWNPQETVLTVTLDTDEAIDLVSGSFAVTLAVDLVGLDISNTTFTFVF